MRKFQHESDLIKCLDAVAESLSGVCVEPIFLGECPNKFNDAAEDDLWYAVQAGAEYWEQSHFFEYRSEPFVRERSSYSLHLDKETIKDRGAEISSDRIAILRHALRALQKSGWRKLLGYDGLTALVIERGQRWLVLEQPNVDDAEIYSWGEEGLFEIGETDRIDQQIGKPVLLQFSHVEKWNVDWLGAEAKRYFRPVLQDAASAKTLADVLWEAVIAIREQTSASFALLSNASPHYHGAAGRFSRPEAFSEALRQREGEFRRPSANGEWPKYRPDMRVEPTEYSDLAKTMHTALANLEDSDWRKLFGMAFGETLDHWQLGLLANTDIAVLVRDNAAFEVTPNELRHIGAFAYTSFPNFDKFLPAFVSTLNRRSTDA
jgi:hypothetical protein